MEPNLPSNRQFGVFCTSIFAVIGFYFYIIENEIGLGISLGIGVSFLAATLIKSNLLIPINKAWFRFGMILGRIFNPLIIGGLYFLLILPLAMFMRAIQRDALRLHTAKSKEKWVARDTTRIDPESFKNQY